MWYQRVMKKVAYKNSIKHVVNINLLRFKISGSELQGRNLGEKLNIVTGRLIREEPRVPDLRKMECFLS